MSWRTGALGVLVVVVVAGGCATDERQWMKLNAKYTTEDFRRDRERCLRDGRLDEVCMRDLGWVAVNPGGATEASKDPHARDIMPPSQRGGRR